MNRHLVPRLVVSSVMLLAGCSDLAPSAETQTNEQSGAVVVQVEPVRIATFEKVISGVGTCTAIPTHQSSITAAVDGLVDKILVAEGTRVTAGDPLIRLDDQLAQNELA